ncbi:helix-turn-helix transcriptional regulator [Pseudomonas aeruginosa]|nr:helix-turn-helix transcriptional regulator [Pseudomonas aeruginosa]
MTAEIVDLQDARLEKRRAALDALFESDFFGLTFSQEHCRRAREMLGWSVEALAFKSGASPTAIRKLEDGGALRYVTMQALAYALEKEALIFLPGLPPMIGDNCRGGTKDPRERDDYHLIE